MPTLSAMPLPENLHVDLRGNVSGEAIREAYRQHEMKFFPTPGDEWNLVVGNDRAQGVVALVRDGVNGFLEQSERPRRRRFKSPKRSQLSRRAERAQVLGVRVFGFGLGTGSAIVVIHKIRASMLAKLQLLSTLECLHGVRKSFGHSTTFFTYYSHDRIAS